MPAAQIFVAPKSFEDSSGYILARIEGMNAQPITKASLAASDSILLRVYDKERPPETAAVDDAAVIAARSIDKSTNVFDTLQTDSGWDLDADPDGFNLKVEILPADLPSGGKTYKFEFKFTDANAKVWPFVTEVPTEGLYSS